MLKGNKRRSIYFLTCIYINNGYFRILRRLILKSGYLVKLIIKLNNALSVASIKIILLYMEGIEHYFFFLLNRLIIILR